MMASVRIAPQQGSMSASLTDVPAFPGARFGLGYPEAIGDIALAQWPNRFSPVWEEAGGGSWMCRAVSEGELEYTLLLEPHEDYVEARYTLTNLSPRAWRQGMAFNCFQCGAPPELRDHECLRHWVGVQGSPERLVEQPRRYSPRPAVQLYSVAGALPGSDIPFVASFRATPDVALDGWMAIVSRDGTRLAATVSQPALFLFQNMEYSCIHSANGFGPLEPGATAQARNRVYFVESGLEEWHRRMTPEMAP